MTVTDPAGDPSLLQTIVRTDHRRLAQLVKEGRRDTSGTPGAHAEIVHDLAASLARHLNAEVALIHPHVQASLDEDRRAQLSADARVLQRLFEHDAAAWDLDAVGDALTQHAQLVEHQLAELRAAIGGKRMANLGYEFARASEAAPTRVVPDR